MRGGFRKSGHEKEGPQLKARKAPDGFKPDAAAGLNRNATTSACVGWDGCNIENQRPFRKQRGHPTPLQTRRSKWLDDHEDHDPDHQYRRYLIDNSIEFLAA